MTIINNIISSNIVSNNTISNNNKLEKIYLLWFSGGLVTAFLNKKFYNVTKKRNNTEKSLVSAAVIIERVNYCSSINICEVTKSLNWPEHVSLAKSRYKYDIY